MLTERFIVYAYPALVRAALLAWAALVALNAKTLADEFRGLVTKKGAALLSLVFLGALALRLYALPHGPLVYYDEYDHLNISQNLARLNAFAESRVGGSPDFDALVAPWWPPGFHVLLALVFRLLGFSIPAAFQLNAWIGGLSVLLIFLLGAHTFQDEKTGLLSAIGLALLPAHLQYSAASVGLSPGSLFWILASLLTLSFYSRRKTYPLYLLFLASLVYAVHSRPENFILVPLLLGTLVYKGNFPFEKSPKWLAAHLGFLILLAPIAVLLYHNKIISQAGYDDSLREILAHFRSNSADNLRWLFDPLSNHLVLLPLFFYGAAQARQAHRHALDLHIPLLAGFFAFYSAFSFGDFYFWNCNKYSLAIDLPLILLAAYGLRRLLALSPWAKPAAVLIAALFAALSARMLIHHNASLAEEKAKHQFLADSAKVLPQGVYVISHMPASVIVTTGRPSVSADIILGQKNSFDSQLAQNGHSRDLILFQDFWWYAREPLSRRLEAMLRKDYDFTPIAQTTIGSLTYAFYHLRPKR